MRKENQMEHSTRKNRMYGAMTSKIPTIYNWPKEKAAIGRLHSAESKKAKKEG